MLGMSSKSLNRAEQAEVQNTFMFSFGGKLIEVTSQNTLSCHQGWAYPAWALGQPFKLVKT